MSAVSHQEAKSLNDAAKSKRIAYWVTTGVLVFCMTGGFFELLSLKTTTDGITKLGYPAYIIPVLGLGKVLAILAILWPGFPRLKEWAYAGFFFDLTAAAVSRAAVGDSVADIVAPLVFLALVVASWALRPASRSLAAAAVQEHGSTPPAEDALIASPVRA